MLFYRESALDVLLLLEQYQSDEYAVKRSLTEMARHFRDTPTSSAALRSQNFAPRLCACVQAYATSLTIMSCLCVLLDRLLHLESEGGLHHASVVRSGLWKVVVDSMKHDGTNIDLHVMGCALTAQLCMEQPHLAHESNQNDMVQGGILDLLYTSMQTNECAKIYVGAARTVAALVHKNATAADRVLKTDLPQLFSMGLHTYFKHAVVVSAIAGVLFQLHVAAPAKAQQSFLAWGCMDRVRTCSAAHVPDVDTQYQLLRTLEVTLRDNETAKDMFCAKEMPFHVVTTFEEVVAAAGGGGAPHQPRGPPHVAFLAFVVAVLFGHVAVMSNVSTPTGGTVVHPARVQVLMKASVHTFAVSALTQFPKANPVLEQCIRLIEFLALPGMYKPILTRAGAMRCIKYIASTKTAHDGLQLVCRRTLAALDV